MAITAKVRCGARVQLDAEHDVVYFGPDYYSEDAREVNASWAYATPCLAIQMNVRRDVPFESGASYTLTFDKHDA